MTRLSRTALTLGLLLASAAEAQQSPASGVTAQPARTRPPRIISSRKPWVVVYDHLHETMTVRDARGHERSSVKNAADADGPMLRIPPDRPIELRVVNANPMLYVYDVSTTVVQERRARGCRAVLGTFAQAGLQFRALSMGELPQRWSVDTALKQMLTAEAIAARGGPAATRGDGLSDADRASTLALVGQRVQVFESRAARLAGFTASLGDSLRTIAELADASAAGTLLDSLAAAIRTQLPGASRSTDVAVAIRGLSTEAAQPATVLMQLSAGGAADVQPVRARFDSALTSLVRSYRELQAQLYRVEQYRAAVDQRFTVEPSGDYRALRIRLEGTREFADVPRFKLGAVEALVNPTSRLSCNLAPGVALAETPREYALRGDTLVRSNGTGQRTAASLLLHLDVADLPLPVGGLAGIGLGANKRPDWYLGGSLRLSDVVRLNAGALWQREATLPAGRSLGAVVPTSERASVADAPKRYRPGFFWGISLVP